MNRVLFKVHGALAVAACIPLLVICTSGSVIVFKQELDRLFMADTVQVVEQAQRLPFDVLLGELQRQFPQYEVVGWAVPDDPGMADRLYLIREDSSDWSSLYLDAFTGRALVAPEIYGADFSDWLVELHYTLLLGDVGTVVGAVCALILLALAATGIALHRMFWKRMLVVRWRSRMLPSDLHKRIGVLSGPILIVLAFTGAWWNTDELLHELEAHADGVGHHVMRERLYGDALSLDALIADARRRIPGFRARYVTLPYEPGVDVSVWGAVPDAGIFASDYASVVRFDPVSGRHQQTSDVREASLSARILDSYRRLHFGDFAGLPSRLLWSLVGMMPLVLAATGLTLWWRRRPQKRANRLRAGFRYR